MSASPIITGGYLFSPSSIITEGFASGAVVSKHVILTLTSDGSTAVTGLTGLKWAFFDQITPDLFTAPSAKGVAESTDGSGVLDVDVSTSSLAIGAVGWLTITNSDGTVSQSPPGKAFSGPVVIS